MSLTIGSLFSGYGGLDMAVEAVFGARTVWHAETEPAPSKVLAAHWPAVPNLGDVTAVDWTAVEPVDVICGGSPCQDVSAAGKRAGMRAGTRSGLWASMCDAIETVRPALVVWENVRGVLSAEADSALEPCPGCVGDADDGAVLRALGRVLGDLADLGYDARWHGLRAADIGAPHGRFRVFVVAHAQNVGHERGRRARDRRNGSANRNLVTADASRDGRDEGWAEPAGIVRGSDAAQCGATPADAQSDAGRVRDRDGGTSADSDSDALRQQPVAERRRSSTPVAGHAVPAADADCGGFGRNGLRRELVGVDSRGRQASAEGRSELAWGQYERAIRRWEQRLGRLAPAPTELAPKGGQRLSPRFVEWMMGLPLGWVTDVPGVTRNEQLKMLGNGVVPQQAGHALRLLLDARAAA